MSRNMVGPAGQDAGGPFFENRSAEDSDDGAIRVKVYYSAARRGQLEDLAGRGDGVARGHQAFIKKMKARAARSDSEFIEAGGLTATATPTDREVKKSFERWCRTGERGPDVAAQDRPVRADPAFSKAPATRRSPKAKARRARPNADGAPTIRLPPRSVAKDYQRRYFAMGRVELEELAARGDNAARGELARRAGKGGKGGKAKRADAAPRKAKKARKASKPKAKRAAKPKARKASNRAVPRARSARRPTYDHPDAWYGPGDDDEGT